MIIQLLNSTRSVRSSGCRFFKSSHRLLRSCEVKSIVSSSSLVKMMIFENSYGFPWGGGVKLWTKTFGLKCKWRNQLPEIRAWQLIWFRSKMSAMTSGTTVSATGSFDGVSYYENNKIELYIFNSIWHGVLEKVWILHLFCMFVSFMPTT